MYPSPDAPPAAKKQKTAPVVVDDDEAENGAKGEEDEEPDEGEDEELDEGEDVEESAADTAAQSGPAADAAEDKGGVVPKESDLPETEVAEEEKWFAIEDLVSSRGKNFILN